jgi:UDP-N-acetylmuramate-alanine ligase
MEHILFPKSPDISRVMKQLLFVIEADEYNHHFLYLDTDYACITNIELDHADVYGTFENYLNTFKQFADKVKKNIFVIAEEPGIQEFIQTQVDQKIVTTTGRTFDFTHLLGAHNHSNASLALACGEHLCKPTNVLPEKATKRSPDDVGRGGPLAVEGLKNQIKHSLSTFQGLRRRGELL